MHSTVLYLTPDRPNISPVAALKSLCIPTLYVTVVVGSIYQTDYLPKPASGLMSCNCNKNSTNCVVYK